MIDIGSCSCETAFRTSEAHLRRGGPYLKADSEIRFANGQDSPDFFDEGRMLRNHTLQPNTPRFGILNYRIFDGRTPSGNYPLHPGRQIHSNRRSSSPFVNSTLLTDMLPIFHERYKQIAQGLLANQNVVKTQIEVGILDDLVRNGFLQHLLSATSQLIPWFIPFCGNCQGRSTGSCIPLTTYPAMPGNLNGENFSLVDIERQISGNGNFL
jgi:hypothetical protein